MTWPSSSALSDPRFNRATAAGMRPRRRPGAFAIGGRPGLRPVFFGPPAGLTPWLPDICRARCAGMLNVRPHSLQLSFPFDIYDYSSISLFHSPASTHLEGGFRTPRHKLLTVNHLDTCSKYVDVFTQLAFSAFRLRSIHRHDSQNWRLHCSIIPRSNSISGHRLRRKSIPHCGHSRPNWETMQFQNTLCGDTL